MTLSELVGEIDSNRQQQSVYPRSVSLRARLFSNARLVAAPEFKTARLKRARTRPRDARRRPFSTQRAAAALAAPHPAPDATSIVGGQWRDLLTPTSHLAEPPAVAEWRSWLRRQRSGPWLEVGISERRARPRPPARFPAEKFDAGNAGGGSRARSNLTRRVSRSIASPPAMTTAPQRPDCCDSSASASPRNI